MASTDPSTRSLPARRKLPARYAGIVMPLILSVLMTFVVSLVSTLAGRGAAPGFLAVWTRAWGLSWLVAYPTLLLVLPLVRRATAAVVEIEHPAVPPRPGR